MQCLVYASHVLSVCADEVQVGHLRHAVLQVLKCQHPSGGFGGSERHDPHMLYTVSAVQILALYDKLELLDIDRVVTCKLQSHQAPQCEPVELTCCKYTHRSNIGSLHKAYYLLCVGYVKHAFEIWNSFYLPYMLQVLLRLRDTCP